MSIKPNFNSDDEDFNSDDDMETTGFKTFVSKHKKEAKKKKNPFENSDMESSDDEEIQSVPSEQGKAVRRRSMFWSV